MHDAQPVGVSDCIRDARCDPQRLHLRHTFHGESITERPTLEILHGDPGNRDGVVVEYRDDPVMIVDIRPRPCLFFEPFDICLVERPFRVGFLDGDWQSFSVSTDRRGVDRCTPTFSDRRRILQLAVVDLDIGGRRE